jgi:cyclopropane-fatty-acyl-phospholipid synthase
MASEQAALGRGASQAAIERHYDIGADFYRLWLDRRMVYSCALWDRGFDDDLDAAQLAKLDWHATAARVDGAARVLDVGCGWGAMLRYLTGTRSVAHATGLTLSPDQAAVATDPPSPSVEVRLEDWRDHHPEVPYDAIVSIGAFEHFARPQLGGAERRAVYAEFFARGAGWLRPGGRLSLQTIAYEDFDPETGAVSSFFTDEIFPESTLPLFGDIVAASDPWFAVVAVRSDAAHYEHTLRLWQNRLEASRDAAVALVGAETTRRWLRYLRVSRAMFDRRVATLYRIAFERRPEPVRLTDAPGPGGRR